MNTRQPKTDYIGYSYKGMTVVERTEWRTSGGASIWRVDCDCGKTHLRNSSQLKRQNVPRECFNFYPHNYIDGGKEAQDRKLQREYGITKEYYKQMLDDQDFKCAICECSFEDQQINVDHDHSTGEVRGLLCSKCNWGLGNFDDNILRLGQAARYLFKYANAR